MSFEHEVDCFIAEKKDEIIELLTRLIAAKSVASSATSDKAPFGDGVREALDIMLDAAQKYGIDAIDGGGYFGFAQLKGEREDYLATLSHLDVVPAGDGWNTDPFTLTHREGYLLGRGASDNKGPSVLSLFALLFFKDRPLNLSMRAIFGCDEETGMTDMDRYNALYEPPFFAFTPDGNFPVGYGEKSVIEGSFESKAVFTTIKEFTGSDAGNVIPKRAEALVKADMKPVATDSVDVDVEGDCFRLTAHGTGGHTADPWKAINAADVLIDYLLSNSLCTPDEKDVLSVIKQISSDCSGEKIGIAATMPHFSPLTVVPSMFSIEDGKIITRINIRAPFGCVAEDINEQLAIFAEKNNHSYNKGHVSYGIFTDPTSKPVRILCDVYNNAIGKKAEPVTMSGGTYARKLDNCVSYGMGGGEPKEHPDFVGIIHGADEAVSIELLLFSLRIYIIALNRLQEECGAALAEI